MFVLQVICVVIFVYGLLSLIQDILDEITYKKVSHNMKIVIFAKELEKNLEPFIIELYNIKKINYYKQIIVIDLTRNDDIDIIKERLSRSDVNIDILDYQEGREYVSNLTQSEDVSFI